MLFTNSRSISKTNGMQQMTSAIPFSIIGARYRANPHQHLQQQQQQPQYNQPPPNVFMQTRVAQQPAEDKPTTRKPMKWGEPTWFLFHTLAEKVKDEYFDEIRKELLDVIYTICVNLPCPTCASHATKYMNGVNYSTIRTKQQLKDMLFSFHNSVNERKNYPLFDYAKLDEKYSMANTINIIQNFMIFFKDKHASIHMIANDLHRNRIANILKQWFNEKMHYFNM
jgi:hypothetical protein